MIGFENQIGAEAYEYLKNAISNIILDIYNKYLTGKEFYLCPDSLNRSRKKIVLYTDPIPAY